MKMPRPGKEVRGEVYRFLTNNHIAVLATLFEDQPSASVVYYVADQDLNFYILTKRGTDKYKNIVLNNKVGLVVGFGPSHINVRISGKATFLYGEDKVKVLQNIKELVSRKKIRKYPLYHLSKFTQEKGPLLRSEVIVKIKPHRLFFFNLDDKKYKKGMSGQDMRII